MGAGTGFEERLRLIFETYGAEKVQKDLAKIQITNNKSTKDMMKSSFERRYGMKTINKEFKKRSLLQTQVNKNDKQSLLLAKAKTKESKRFKGEYLSIMFAGMALQRAFGGLFKSMIKDYKELTKESVTPLSEAMTRLEANWKFLKFAMLDAASPLIANLANMLANFAHAFANMNPERLKGFAVAIGALAGLGGLATVFGQGALLVTGLGTMAAHKNTVTALNTMAGIKTAPMTAGAKFFREGSIFAKLGGIILIGLGIKEMVSGLMSIEGASFGDILKASLMTGIGVGLLFANLPAGVIATGVIALTMSVDTLAKRQGTSLQEDLKRRALATGIISGGEEDITKDLAFFMRANLKDLAQAKILKEGLTLNAKSQLRVEEELASKMERELELYALNEKSAEQILNSFEEMTTLTLPSFDEAEEALRISEKLSGAVSDINRDRYQSVEIFTEGVKSWERLLTKQAMYKHLFTKRFGEEGWAVQESATALETHIQNVNSILETDLPNVLETFMKDPIWGFNKVKDTATNIANAMERFKKAVEDLPTNKTVTINVKTKNIGGNSSINEEIKI